MLGLESLLAFILSPCDIIVFSASSHDECPLRISIPDISVYILKLQYKCKYYKVCFYLCSAPPVMTMVSLSGIPQEYSPECFSANESPPERKGYKRDIPKRGKKKMTKTKTYKMFH